MRVFNFSTIKLEYAKLLARSIFGKLSSKPYLTPEGTGLVLSLSDVSVAYSMFPVETENKQDFTAVEENLQCVMCRKHEQNVR